MALHEPGKGSDPSQYKELPLAIMRINERYDFDIYLQIKADYRLFAAKGALFTEQHSQLLKSGYTKLFVREADWDKVEEYKSQYLSSILTDPTVSSREKAEVAYDTSMKSIRDVFKSVESRTIKHVERNAETMVKLILSEDEVMDNLIWINTHDHYTYQHSVRVGIYATVLTLKLLGHTLNKDEMVALSSGFFLHDIGMADVPLKVLDKRAPLSPSEWGLVRQHPMWGFDRLLETGHLTPEAAAIVLSHHERHNGSGYPFSREGDGIPIYAKICAIADIFESLTAVRPYRQAKEPFEALRTMQNEMSQDFDPEVFRAFIHLLGPKK
jgi:HD-GYP domain-containing protein (c-di-GMP phosphodiesterase class II)